MTFLSGFAAIAGPPNVGKSTLLNRVLGAKTAIVTPKPQTTRNRILGVLHGDGYQIVFLDTPGIHRTRTSLHRSMVASALAALREVDVVLVMIEMGRPHDQEISLVLRNLRSAAKPSLLLINKIDMGPRQNLLPIMDEYRKLYPFEVMIPISALKGDGVDILLKELKARLRPGPAFFPPDMGTDQSEAFYISEIIREKVYNHTRDELPYSTAVTVEGLNTRPEKNFLVISAVIHVETPSQRRILIGEGGAMIKAIGRSARVDLEKIFDGRVYLELKVRVEENWSRDPKALRRMGY